MVRAPCCEKTGLNKGPWTPEEDQILVNHIRGFGHGNWRALPKQAGLLRCGKSCRLRWLNYLRPDIKRGNFTEEEEETIVQLHRQLGNRWSAIAASLPGRTDNEIKNVWHTNLKRRLVDPNAASGTQKKRKKKSKTKSESSDASRLVEPLDRSNSGTSKNELHVESQIEGFQLETLSMDFTAAAAAEFSTVDISTSIVHEFLEDSEMERFWLDALSMNVIATETPTDQSNSDLSSCTIEMPNGDKPEDELHVAPEIESFWLDPLSIDFATIGIPTSPSHYFNLFNSDNDRDFWQEDSQDQELF